MIPDLMAATRQYWRQLDQLEAAYRRREISLEEVDARVQELMAELGETRREVFRAFGASLRYRLRSQREAVFGIACVLMAALWLAVSSA